MSETKSSAELQRDALLLIKGMSDNDQKLIEALFAERYRGDAYDLENLATAVASFALNFGLRLEFKTAKQEEPETIDGVLGYLADKVEVKLQEEAKKVKGQHGDPSND